MSVFWGLIWKKKQREKSFIGTQCDGTAWKFNIFLAMFSQSISVYTGGLPVFFAVYLHICLSGLQFMLAPGLHLWKEGWRWRRGLTQTRKAASCIIIIWDYFICAKNSIFLKSPSAQKDLGLEWPLWKYTNEDKKNPQQQSTNTIKTS